MIKIIQITFVATIILMTSCGKKGCTDPNAINYDEDAERYDKTCEYAAIINEDSLNLYLRINHKFQGQTLDFNGEYNVPAGSPINLAVFRYYMSQIRIGNSSTSEEVEDIELIDINVPSSNILKFKATPGNYSNIDFAIGVPDYLNKADPSVYPVGHPLSSLNATYWVWSTQYRFILLEGKADTGNGSFDLNYVYHTGIDTCFRTVNYPMSFTVPSYEDSVIVDLYFDFEEFWNGNDTINVKTEPITHVTDHMEIAIKASDNFAKAFHP